MSDYSKIAINIIELTQQQILYYMSTKYSNNIYESVELSKYMLKKFNEFIIINFLIWDPNTDLLYLVDSISLDSKNTTINGKYCGTSFSSTPTISNKPYCEFNDFMRYTKDNFLKALFNEDDLFSLDDYLNAGDNNMILNTKALVYKLNLGLKCMDFLVEMKLCIDRQYSLDLYDRMLYNTCLNTWWNNIVNSENTSIFSPKNKEYYLKATFITMQDAKTKMNKCELITL